MSKFTFVRIPETFNVCKAWADRGLMTEDRKTVFTQSPANYARLFPTSCPVERLKMAIKHYALCPGWEGCGFHFKRCSPDNWSSKATQDKLFGEGCILEHVNGGWSFGGNFAGLSLGFSLHTSDLELAKDLLTLIAENYASQEYKEAVSRRLKGEEGSRLYFVESQSKFCVANSRDIKAIENFDNIRSEHDRDYVKTNYIDGKLLGKRIDLDMSDLVNEYVISKL